MVRRLFYGKKRTEAQRRENRTGWAFMAPFGILFAIVFFYAIYSSFFRQVTEGSRHRYGTDRWRTRRGLHAR